jgi:hypothetical protein
MGESVQRVVGLLAAGLGLIEQGRSLSASQLLESFDPARLTRPGATAFDEDCTSP